MAGIVKSSQEDLLLRVNAVMVIGNENSRNGKVHHIIVSSDETVPPEKQEHMVIPFKLHNNIISTIQRILTSKNLNTHNVTLDTRLKDGDNLCNDLSSLGLSIAIGIEASLSNHIEKWEGILKKWCFTGEVDAASGEIVRIGGARKKLEAASKTEDINYIMMPSDNRNEAINWLKEKGSEYKEKIYSDVKISDSRKTPFILKRMWSLATRNVFVWVALILWFLSILYIPVRFTLWDTVMSWKTGTPQVTVSLPGNNEYLSKKLLNNGFSEEQVQKFTSSSLARTDMQQTVLVKNMDGAIEFEIINSQDWTMMSTYMCGVYIISFIFVIFIPVLGQRDSSHKEKIENINYDAILLSIDNKEIEIAFVDNIRQAEAIVEHKSTAQTQSKLV